MDTEQAPSAEVKVVINRIAANDVKIPTLSPSPTFALCGSHRCSPPQSPLHPTTRRLKLSQTLTSEISLG